jgi:hypothetical protein
MRQDNMSYKNQSKQKKQEKKNYDRQGQKILFRQESESIVSEIDDKVSFPKGKSACPSKQGSRLKIGSFI